MIEIFIELTDSLFYPGYTEDMALDNPEWFQFEFAEFLNNYGADL